METKAGEEVAKWRAWLRWAEVEGLLPFMNMLVCRARLERHLRSANRITHGV
jgi:hypothetical protein